MLRTLNRLLADRTAATAVVAALVIPVITATAGAGIDVSLIESDLGHLQAAADAGAGAARQYLNPADPSTGQSTDLVNYAIQYANQNYAGSLNANDVVQGWYDVTAKSFGPPIAGQTTQYDGNYFTNAVQVTTRSNHPIVFGALLGLPTIALSRQSVAYKCSNTNYPLTLIASDPVPPGYDASHPTGLPAIWASFSADGHGPNQSYYYANSDGHLNPVFKFYVPSDGTDVSFVVTGSNGVQMQVDSYCRGTFLVVPDAFDISPSSGQNWNPQVNFQNLRGSTNDSFAVYPDQQDYPMAPGDSTTTYFAQGAVQISYLTDPQVPIHTTPYPNYQGCCQYWASAGDPTPARRATMVQ